MADLCEWGCNTPLTPDDAHGLCAECQCKADRAYAEYVRDRNTEWNDL